MDQHDISYFDPKAEWSIFERGLPHWTQANCVVFITWRLGDSLPVDVLQQLDAEIEVVLRSERLDPSVNWKLQLASRDPTCRGRVQWKLFALRDSFLDRGYGACHLANSVDAMKVMDSLQINKRLGQRGEFWQVDQFDHLIRSPEQFEHYRRYIAENPRRANLQAGTFPHFQKQLAAE